MTFQSPQPGLEPISYHPGIEVLGDPVERDVIQPRSGLVEVDSERTFSQSGAYQPQEWASTASAGYLDQTSHPGYVPTKAELPGNQNPNTDSATVEHLNKKKTYLRRTLWYLVIAALVVVISGSVGGGVAGGLLKQRHQNLNPSQSTVVIPSGSTHASDSTSSVKNSAQGATTAQIATSTNTQSRSAPNSSPSSSTGPGGVTIECPDVNNTVYTSNGLRFMRQCGINYGSVEGAIDLRNLDASNMEECIGYCAQYVGLSKCIGVTWVYVGPQGTAFNYCWLKSNRGKMVATYFDSMDSALLMQG